MQTIYKYQFYIKTKCDECNKKRKCHIFYSTEYERKNDRTHVNRTKYKICRQCAIEKALAGWHLGKVEITKSEFIKLMKKHYNISRKESELIFKYCQSVDDTITTADIGDWSDYIAKITEHYHEQ